MLRTASALLARRTKNAVELARTTSRGLAAAAEGEVKLPPQYSIPGRYAAALYMAAVKADKLAAVEDELSQVSDLVAQSQEFSAFVKDPSLPTQSKVEGLNAVLDKMGASDITKNFMALLSENNRLAELDAIMASFSDIAAEQRGEVKAVVTTAEEMSAEEVDELADGLANLLKPGQTLVLQEEVDPTMIGGIKIDFAGKSVDLSIVSRVRKLQQLIRGSAV